MSPLGIKRLVAIVLVLSPWIFIPGIFKDIVFIIAGVFLFIGTLDLRKKAAQQSLHQENESAPRAVPREAYTRSEEAFERSGVIPIVETTASA